MTLKTVDWPHITFSTNFSWAVQYNELEQRLGPYGQKWRWKYDHTQSICTIYFRSEEDKVMAILKWL